MRKILVTGGTGFIGSAVVRTAISRGYEIVNVDSLTYAACPENLSSVDGHKNYEFEMCDITNLAKLTRVFAKHKPDAVMHLAAESHVDRSIDSPSAFIQTNIVGTFNLLEVSRKYWHERDLRDKFCFHHVSTDEVYGSLSTDTEIQFTEDTAYDPRSPYSASKASSDHLVRAWNKTYGLPTIITNCSNNYGPFHFPEKLVPITIINALEGKPIPIYGDGSNIRDWLYVEDHADALLLVLAKGKRGYGYNIGGENERTNLTLVMSICKILDRLKPKSAGSFLDQIIFVEDRPGHDARYAISPERMRNELDWHPSVTIEEGLELTVEWYLNNEDWWRPLLDRNGVGYRLGTTS